MTPEDLDDIILYQACAIPFRQGDKSVEYCLITSTRTNEWSFPKGTIKRDETAIDTALKRARKEVGLHGKIIAQLGTYRYRKWEMTLEVAAMLMQVDRCDDEWEDSSARERRWAELPEAISLVRRDELKSLLEAAEARLQN